MVTHYNLYSQGFQQLCELASRKQVRLHIQVAEPVGEWDGKTDMLLTPEDSAYLKELFLKCPTLPNGQTLLHRDIYCEHGDRCPAGTEFLSLTADGELFACNFLQFSLGNIRHKSIKQMREALLTSQWFNGKQPKCLPGEDQVFIESFILPYKNHPKPLDAHKIFNLKEPRGE